MGTFFGITMYRLRHFTQIIWGSVLQHTVNQNLPTFFFVSSQYPARALRVAIGNLHGDYTASTDRTDYSTLGARTTNTTSAHH